MFIFAGIAVSYMVAGAAVSLLLAGITLFKKNGLISNFIKS